MKPNIATWDRILRFAIGIWLTAWASAGGPYWAFVGIPLIATASWRISPLYSLLRTGTLVRTRRAPPRS